MEPTMQKVLKDFLMGLGGAIAAFFYLKFRIQQKENEKLKQKEVIDDLKSIEQDAKNSDVSKLINDNNKKFGG